ncbi:MAG TPA: hypothetical protein VF101_10500 [Gaiellaceae bacterium]
MLSLRRVVRLAVLAWIGRWAAMEVASHRGRGKGPPPNASERAPGHMPGPFDRR